MKFIFGSVLSFLGLFVFFRLFFVVLFFQEMQGTANELIRALWVGLRFDLRLAVFILVPVGLFFMIPFINPLRMGISKQLVNIYLRTAAVLVTFFFAFDIAHYGYLNHRIDVSAFKLLENPLIALHMVWESYPVVWSIIGLSILIWATWWCIEKAFKYLDDPSHLVRSRDKIFAFTLGGFILLFAMWGTFRQYRLLWSDAHFSEDPFIVSAALNPVLYFNETRTFYLEDFDEEITREYYEVMARDLGVDEPNKDNLNFNRWIPARNSAGKKPNIVIIFLESVGLNRMGRVGNPLDPTPNLDQISRKGIFFNRFYIPMVGTARSVFGLVTGIHDVASVETASSNPRIVDQYSLINALAEYEKHYFLGGSASWRNIRGLLNNNIPDIQIRDQDDLDYPRLDVWGISDHDLFKAAHEKFQSIDPDQPFFAVIQTASNHKPYSIPGEVANFEIRPEVEDVLNSAGFKSQGQYNAMRLLDHVVGEYFSYAEKADYFENTIFLFFGDHGTSDPRAEHMPPADFELKLRSYNVPFIIYNPHRITEGLIRSDIAQLVDLMPTICGLVGVSYENRTMGRDLLDTEFNEAVAFIVNKKMANPHIAVVGQDYYLSMQKDGSDIRLHRLGSKNPLVDVKEIYPEITDNYSWRLKGIYETAKYMLYNNQK
ncbi:MAG: sulfatase-like hydrolase/transferase [Candidatus Marinimicrobia bacterium]|nr:sulfatase-like hydrolase/transferase [Candidatus Neomarinimicrobiota bacterium]